MELKIKDYLTWRNFLISILIAMFCYSACNSIKTGRIKEANAKALGDSVSYFKNRIGTQTATINLLRLDNEQLQDFILDKDAELATLTKGFSKVNSILKSKSVTTIPFIAVPYKDSVPCVFDRSGSFKEDWYSFMYKSNQKGIQIDSLTIPNTSTTITGFKRKWFLGQQTAVTDITNSNPFIKVTEIKSIEVTVPEPWYKKWYVWLVTGIVGGFLISN